MSLYAERMVRLRERCDSLKACLAFSIAFNLFLLAALIRVCAS